MSEDEIPIIQGNMSWLWKTESTNFICKWIIEYIGQIHENGLVKSRL